jgi:sarcosine oxidase subunit alpha
MARLDDPRFAPDCEITFDGRRVPARAGESVASALLAAGRPLVARSAKYHRPRGPFCLAGSCGSCLARIDGQPNQRTCRVVCRPGMAVESQNTILGVDHDLLALVDRVYAHGLDHHTLMTWNRLANRAAIAVSRQLAGLGKLPSAPPAPSPPAAEERFDAVVVGAGPAGLGAAEALAAAGRRALLVDDAPVAGGRLRARLGLPGDPPDAWVAEVLQAVRRAGGEVALSSAAAGFWRDGGPLLGVLADGTPPRLRTIRARSFVLATGTSPQPPDLDDGDLPGVFAARGLVALHVEHGVVPGASAAVLAEVEGDQEEAEAVVARLAAAGVRGRRVEGARAVRGPRRVTALLLDDGGELACDTVAVVGRGLPAADLARLAGARLRPDAFGHFELSADGPTLAPGVLGAGELLGPRSARDAADEGRRAGEAAARG